MTITFDVNSFAAQFIGSPTIDTSRYAKHHIIPTAEANASTLLKALAARSLYNHADFATNGLALPATVEEARSLIEQGKPAPLQYGPHPAYSEFVKDGLLKIETDVNSGRIT